MVLANVSAQYRSFQRMHNGKQIHGKFGCPTYVLPFSQKFTRMKHVLITGASTGIGYGTAEAFLAKGYHVYGSVRKQADADRLKAELGANFTPLLFDVTDTQGIQAAVKQLENEIGNEGLACLVNNAGVATSGPVMLQPIDDFRYQFEVNLFGLLAVTQAFLPLLGATKNPKFPPGRIIMISSVGGKLSGPFLGAYSASKHALEGMTGSLRRELQLYGIDVIVVAPGAIKTPIWDKPSAQELGIFEGSDYDPMMRKFQSHFVKNGRAGLPARWLGDRIVAIHEKRKPKARYAYVPNHIKDWVIPMMIPTRMLDRIIGKATGLLKK
jgi:NAD(P)-dependent dehydrogenase (short-subunit alcohol dehydrogenase family)